MVCNFLFYFSAVTEAASGIERGRHLAEQARCAGCLPQFESSADWRS